MASPTSLESIDYSQFIIGPHVRMQVMLIASVAGLILELTALTAGVSLLVIFVTYLLHFIFLWDG